jgi:alpha-D-ribose 1-methylphosphonate 5-triphosphate synthase subunit PhnH
MTMMNDTLWQPAGQQLLFRQILQTMAYPGRCQSLCSDTVMAERAVLATLMDASVSLCDRHALLPEGDWPLLAAQRANRAEEADFILADGAQAPDFMPRTGSLSEPEQSATLVLRTTALGSGSTRLKLTGPGIREQKEVAVSGLHMDWLRKRADWVAAFPMGVDLILADASQIMALPRTTRIEVY